MTLTIPLNRLRSKQNQTINPMDAATKVSTADSLMHIEDDRATFVDERARRRQGLRDAAGALTGGSSGGRTGEIVLGNNTKGWGWKELTVLGATIATVGGGFAWMNSDSAEPPQPPPAVEIPAEPLPGHIRPGVITDGNSIR